MYILFKKKSTIFFTVPLGTGVYVSIVWGGAFNRCAVFGDGPRDTVEVSVTMSDGCSSALRGTVAVVVVSVTIVAVNDGVCSGYCWNGSCEIVIYIKILNILEFIQIPQDYLIITFELFCDKNMGFCAWYIDDGWEICKIGCVVTIDTVGTWTTVVWGCGWIEVTWTDGEL